MFLEPTDTGFQIDAADLGPLLGLEPDKLKHLMREGRIGSLSEQGEGEDAGRHRITFRHEATRVQLIVNDAGEVLQQSRTTIAPKPDASRRPHDAKDQRQ